LAIALYALKDMKFYRHTPLRAWAYLLLGTLLLIGPWVWPLWVLHKPIVETFKLLPGDMWIKLPLITWMLAQSCAGLLLIVLAFCVRPRSPS
jgi:hypothetical protein